MNTEYEKPAARVCEKCGSINKPIRRPSWFESTPPEWFFSSFCGTCAAIAERDRILKTITATASQRDSILLDLGYTPKLIQIVDPMQAPEKIRALCRPPFQSAYLAGPTGSTKTCSLVGGVKETFGTGIVTARETGQLPNIQLPHFIVWPDLLRRMQAAANGQGQDGETYSGLLHKYITCAALVIDDLGARRSTEFSDDVLFEIIDGRDNRLLPTVFTSNYRIRELIEVDSKGRPRVHPRTASRIAGMCGDRVFFLGGPDRRLSAK